MLLRELEQLELNVCPHHLRHRVAHFDAIRYGIGVCEFSPRSTASKEVKRLWGWLASELGIESEIRYL